jgi:hypothetical protein
MRSAGHVARMGEVKSYNRQTWNKEITGSKPTWSVNIKIGLAETRCDSVACIHVAQDVVQ